MAQSTELAVALDFDQATHARELIERLSGLPVIFKVGSELFLSAGPHWVKNLVDSGARVLLDLKLHDIPNTVAQSARKIADLGVERFTVHAAGGPKMLEATRTELESWAKNTGRPRPKILAVTVLTSFDMTSWNQVSQAVSGQKSEIQASVERFATAALSWGTDGIVCSPHELVQIRAKYPGLWTLVPGIRPAGSATHDQVRTMTPKEARDHGASCIVVGRPITQAQDPKAATEAILAQLKDHA